MPIITRSELETLYGTRVPPETIDMIFSECRGNRQECIEQLNQISGSAECTPSMPRQSTTSSDGGGLEHASSEYVVDYDEAVAVGDEKERHDREIAIATQLHEKMDDVAELGQVYLAHKKMEEQQAKLGAQSTRNCRIDIPSNLSAHSQSCIMGMLERELQHCGDFAVFYHSYSLAALIYEVNSCIAEILYGVKDCPPMPRLLKGPFRSRPHVKTLLAGFTSLNGQDHNPNFRAVAISVSCSLSAPQSEAPPMQVFESGYSCADLSFSDVLNNIFRKLGGTDAVSAQLSEECRQIHSSCVGAFTTLPGHMLQIFVRRDVVDDIAYGSLPYGVFDPSSNPLSEHLAKNASPAGQARVFWHPSVFLDPMKSIVYHYAASETVMSGRRAMRESLMRVIAKHLFCTPAKVIEAFRRVELDTEV